jgi:hypothetical protein
MRIRSHRWALVLLLMGASLRAPKGASADQGSAREGKRATPVDLDLHHPPPGDKTPAPTPEGAVLTPPTSTASDAYQLRPAPDGGYLYKGPSFNAHIRVDGSVEFSSRRLSAARDPEDRGRVAEDHDPVTSTEPVAVGGGPGLHFDANNEYLRRLGKDPARDAKAAFLTGTFDLRMKMAFDARSTLHRTALAELPSRLNGLWSDPRLTSAERRHLLHAMWDELGTDPNNARARVVVRDFARRHLPPKDFATFR